MASARCTLACAKTELGQVGKQMQNWMRFKRIALPVAKVQNYCIWQRPFETVRLPGRLFEILTRIERTRQFTSLSKLEIRLVENLLPESFK